MVISDFHFSYDFKEKLGWILGILGFSTKMNFTQIFVVE